MGDEAFRPLVVMPAYNEEEALGDVLAEVFDRLPGWGVVVVSDGSVDRTAQVAKQAGAMVLDLPFNLGVGGALRAGFLYPVRYGNTHALQLDADGQHDPNEVPKLVETMRSTGAGLVIGARFAGTGAYQVRGPRRWAMVVLAKILSRVCRTTLTDTTSGFKLMDRDALTLFSNDYPAEYLGDTIEALVVAARKGVVVRQVGVEMRDRKGGQPSHSPFKAAIFLLRAVVVLVLALTRAMPRENEVSGMPLVFVVAVVLTMVLLMRNRVLKEKYAVWWAVVSIAVLVGALFPQFLEWLSRIVGFVTPANFTFFSGVLLLLVISVQFSVELSRLEDKSRRLAEETAILRASIERLEGGAHSGVPENDVQA